MSNQGLPAGPVGPVTRWFGAHTTHELNRVGAYTAIMGYYALRPATSMLMEPSSVQ
jgi:hypothetical protein